MNKLLFLALSLPLALCADVTNATDAASSAKPRQKITRQKLYEMTGGYFLHPKSMQGKALIYNAQSRVAESNLTHAAERMTFHTAMRFAYAKSATDMPNVDPKAILEQEKAAAVVVVVDNPSQPSLLVAPDDRWAIVNTAKMDADLVRPESKAAFIGPRTSKQIYRAFSLMAGAGKKGNTSPATVNKLSELDAARDAIPVDNIAAINGYLGAFGVTKELKVTYRRACREGWAHAPTNAVEKAIWDKVHELPAKPLQLKK